MTLRDLWEASEFIDVSYVYTPAFPLQYVKLTIMAPKRLGNYDGLPGRPYDSLSIWYVHDVDCIQLSIKDPDVASSPLPNDQKWRPVVRYDGSGFRFLRAGEWWRAGEVRNTAKWTDVQALCFQVMINSDPFCGNQAVSDLNEFGEDPRWQEILDDVARVHAVASVILT